MDLHTARFGGALTLSRARIRKRFLFQKGSPVFAESNLASESLGVQLMDSDQLNRSDYNRVVAHVESRGCQEGSALLELGLLKPKQLFEALRDQVRIRLVECFGWPLGTFEVDPESAPPEDAAPFRADVYAVLQSGIATHWANDRVLADLMPKMEFFPRRCGRFENVAERLARDEALETLLDAFDNNATLWQVLQLAKSQSALAGVWVLDAAGVLDYAAVGADQESASGSSQPSLLRDVEIVVEESSGPAASESSPGKPREAPGAKGKRADPSAERLREQIEERYQGLRGLDGYQLLGVTRNADPAAIKRAYLQAAKSYHPDSLARTGLDDEAREKANKVFAEISKAHAVLSDSQRRREYDSALAVDATDLDAERIARAEMNYRKGEILIRQGNYGGALDFLKPAAELWPDECTYQSALGWALFKKTPPEPEAARERLEEAMRLDPDDGETLLRLSQVLRALGEPEAAQAVFDRAHQT
jgi:tetratricopeptide (TPR) repeat protein